MAYGTRRFNAAFTITNIKGKSGKSEIIKNKFNENLAFRITI